MPAVSFRFGPSPPNRSRKPSVGACDEEVPKSGGLVKQRFGSSNESERSSETPFPAAWPFRTKTIRKRHKVGLANHAWTSHDPLVCRLGDERTRRETNAFCVLRAESLT
jgi:hypothetical protein